MKVSVIIPVYNVEKYFRRCLDSVVNQTYKDIEVILVNDGSPDNSKEICEEYVAKYSNIQLINQKNAGLGAARNTGLQYITGDAVTFVDSDDWLELDAIEYYVASMKKSDADIVVTKMIRKKEYFSNEGTNGATIKEEVLNQEQFAKKYFKIDGNNIEYYACAKLYKREIAREVKYPVGLFAEDVPAAFSYIIRSQKIFYSTKVTYNYFFNDNSLTAKFTDKDFDYVMKMADGKDVFFMNTAHKDPWEQEVNRKLKEKVAQYPNAYLIDWYSYAKGKNQYFYKDRTHPNDKGQRYYADFLTNEIKKHYLEENKEDENREIKKNDILKNNSLNSQNNNRNSEKTIDLRNMIKNVK